LASLSKNANLAFVKQFSRDERTLIFLLAFVKFAHMVDFIIMMPLGPRLMASMNITPQQFSYLVASYSFFAGIAGIISTMFLDWFDRKKAIIFLFGGFFITTLLCGFSPNYESLLINRSVTGVFGGVLGAISFSIAGDAIPSYKRGHAMGIIMSGFSLASVLGIPFGLFLANLSDWHLPFLVLGGLCAFVWFAMFKILKPMRDHIGTNRNPFLFFRELSGNLSLIVCLLFFSFLIFSQFSVISFVSPTLVANVGLLESQLPYVYFLGGLATLFTGPMVGRFSDMHGRLKIFTISLFLSTIPIFFVTNLSISPLWLVLLITTCLFIFIGGRVIPAITIMTEVAPPHLRGSLMSMSATFSNLAAAAAAYTSGMIVVKDSAGHLMNYEKVGYISMVFSILALWLSTKIGYKQAKAPVHSSSSSSSSSSS
jgi:MFS transporter, DHA1 family, inner membrane transport protein